MSNIQANSGGVLEFMDFTSSGTERKFTEEEIEEYILTISNTTMKENRWFKTIRKYKEVRDSFLSKDKRSRLLSLKTAKQRNIPGHIYQLFVEKHGQLCDLEEEETKRRIEKESIINTAELVDEQTGSTSTVSRVNPHGGDITAQSEAVRRLEQKQLYNWNNLEAFLMDFVADTAISQNFFNIDFQRKMLYKLTGPLGREFETAYWEHHPMIKGTLNDNILYCARFIIKKTQQKCDMIIGMKQLGGLVL